MKTIPLVTCYLIALSLLGCRSTTSENFPPLPEKILTLSNEANSDLIIFLRPSRNTFILNDPIVLDMHLKTDIQVSSTLSTTIYLLISEDQAWIEIQNLSPENDDEGFLLNEDYVLDKDNPNGTIVLQPKFEEKEEVTLLIVVVGNKLNNDKSEKTVSYIITTLSP